MTAITPPRPANWLILLILIGLSGVSILSTDLYTPSLPDMPDLLATTPQVVQLTLSLNLAAYAICQLFYGPIADRVGRRPLLLVGIIGFLLSSIACALAPTVEFLIAARIAQGIFASAEAVVTMLLVRELFAGEAGTKAMGFFGMGLGAFPALGPLIGGQVHVLAGWRANFVVVALAILAFGFMAWRLLPETRKPDPKALNLPRIMRIYRGLITDRTVLRYLLPMGASMAGIFAFIAAGPFIIIDQMGIATQAYGLYYGATVVAYIIGSFSVTRLASRVSAEALVNAGVAFNLAGGIGVLALVLSGQHTPLTLVAVLSLSTFSIGLIFGAAPMLLLDEAGDDRRGIASGLLGFFEIGMASLGALAVGTLYDGTAIPFAWVTMISAAIGATAWWGLRPRV